MPTVREFKDSEDWNPISDGTELGVRCPTYEAAIGEECSDVVFDGQWDREYISGWVHLSRTCASIPF